MPAITSSNVFVRVMRSKRLAIERVEADVDAVQAGADQPVAALGKQVAVGGHRKVLHAERFEASNKILDAGAHQGLASGDAHFANAHGDENARPGVRIRPS